MPQVYLPLSGDVTQAINPWSWVFKPMSSQFGLFNINLGHSSNPELEQRILNDVGSYGRQIGRISEALAVLTTHLDIQSLTPKERDAIQAFQNMFNEVELIKRQP